MRYPMRFLLLLMVMLPMRPAHSQTTDLATLLSGGKVPLTLTLGQLDTTWRTFSLSGDTSSSAYMQMYAAMLGGQLSQPYYTQGQTVTAGGETYLVTYRHPVKPIDYAALMRSGGQMPAPRPEPLTPASNLTLSLLDLRTAGSLDNIHPFELQQEMMASRPPSPSTAPVMETAQSDQYTALSNLRQLGLAVLQYSQDYDETLPPMQTPGAAKKAIYPYVKSDAVFVQPGTDTFYQPNAFLSRHKLTTIAAPAQMVLYYENAASPDGKRGVLFADGHVKRISELDWPRLRRASKIPDTARITR